MKDKEPPTLIIYEKAVVKEIGRVVKKVMKDCRKFKVPVSKKIVLDQRIHKAGGWYALTGKARNGTCVLAFSSVLFLHFSHEVEEALRNIAAHELCHTCPRSMNHGRHWKRWVGVLNAHGYRIDPKPYSKKSTPGFY